MKKIEINDLGDIRFLSGLKFSDDGRYAAFKVTKADIDDNKYIHDIWLYVAETGKSWQLTHCDTAGSFYWLDNENLIYTKKEDDKDKNDDGDERTIYRKIYIHGGEGSKYLELDFNASIAYEIAKDEILLTVNSNKYRKDLFNIKKEDRAEELKRRKEEKAWEIIEEVPFWSNGSTFNAGNRKKLLSYNKKTEKIKEITDSKYSVGLVSLNEKKTRAVFSYHENTGKRELESELSIYDQKTGKVTDLKFGKRRFYTAEFLDEDTLFLQINESRAYGLNENAKFFLGSIKNGTVEPIIEDLDISVGSSINSDMRYGGGEDLIVKNGYIYYVETNDTDAILKRMDKKGKVEVLWDRSGSIDCFTVSEKGEILAVAMMENGLQELYSIKDNEAEKLTDFNGGYLKDHSVCKVEEIRSLGENDDIIKGFVIKPADYKKGKKYPGILVIHGGPKTAYGSVFIHEMQVWANAGYFVFFCNPKGSDGKGNEFADIRGRYGEVDYENLMDFCDKVLDTYPDIDEKRLGVTGGSYGGFMTNWIIGHNDGFKCAASQRSISNWMSFFGNSDIGYYFGSDQTAGWPWESADRMWDQSPLKYADKVKTPTLFIHSDEDFRCWVPEAYQMFTALKIHGVESRLVLFHGENHELSRSGKPKNRIKRLTEITEWFNKYLKEEKTTRTRSTKK